MDSAHLWVANFASEAQLEEYFAEQYEDDDAPLNRFIAEQGQLSYDPDWAESIYHGPIDPLAALLAHTYFDDVSDEIADKLKPLGSIKVNASILVSTAEIDSPTSVNGADYQLLYVGAFKVRFE